MRTALLTMAITLPLAVPATADTARHDSPFAIQSGISLQITRSATLEHEGHELFDFERDLAELPFHKTHQGAIEFSQLSVPVPEPAGFALMALGLIGLLRPRK